MKITVIVAKSASSDFPWILGAWDEYTLDDNCSQFSASLEQYRATMPGVDIRTAEIEVPDGFLESIWKPVKVNVRLVGAEGQNGGGAPRGESGEMRGQDGGLKS